MDPTDETEVALFIIPGAPKPGSSVIDVRSVNRVDIDDVDAPSHASSVDVPEADAVYDGVDGFVPAASASAPSSQAAAPFDWPDDPERSLHDFPSEAAGEVRFEPPPPAIAEAPSDDPEALGSSGSLSWVAVAAVSAAIAFGATWFVLRPSADDSSGVVITGSEFARDTAALPGRPLQVVASLAPSVPDTLGAVDTTATESSPSGADDSRAGAIAATAPPPVSATPLAPPSSIGSTGTSGRSAPSPASGETIGRAAITDTRRESVVAAAPATAAENDAVSGRATAPPTPRETPRIDSAGTRPDLAPAPSPPREAAAAAPVEAPPRIDSARVETTRVDVPREEVARPNAARADLPIAEVPRTAPLPPDAPPRATAGAATTAGAAATAGAATAAASAGVAEALKRLQVAYERRDARLVKAVWPSVDERALARAFDGLRSQSVTFDRCQVNVSGAAGEVECRGVTTYVPRVGGQYPRTESRQWRFRVQQSGDGWLIASAAAR